MVLRSGRQTCSRAFSLIELLVSIGIIGVLMSITVPALTSARSAARQTVCLANLKGIGGSFELYSQVSKQRYPYAPPGTLFRTSPLGGKEYGFVQARFWALKIYWTSVLQPVAPWREHFASWVCPGSPREPGMPWRGEGGFNQRPFIGTGVPSYRYCDSFFARPEVWSGALTPQNVAQNANKLLQPVHTWETSFPGAKVMLFDSEMAHLSGVKGADHDMKPMLFADAHAAIKRFSSATAPVVNPFTGGATRLHDTPGGVNGHDY